MKHAFWDDSSPQKTTPSPKSRVVLHAFLPKGTSHKRSEIFNTCLAISFNEKRLKRRSSLHWHIFSSVKFNKLRKLNNRHLGAPKEDLKVLRVRLKMLAAPSCQKTKELRAMRKEIGAKSVLQITPSLKILRHPLH